MWKFQSPPEKSHPLFSSNPSVQVEVLSSTPFLKIWLEAQPPPAEMRGCAHYDNSRLAKTHVWKRVKLSLRGKYIIKPNPCFQAVIHRPNLYYSKISKRKLKKEYAISSGTGKNRTSQTVSSTLHLEGQARYFTVIDSTRLT